MVQSRLNNEINYEEKKQLIKKTKESLPQLILLILTH